jgi:hypothetical protein
MQAHTYMIPHCFAKGYNRSQLLPFANVTRAERGADSVRFVLPTHRPPLNSYSFGLACNRGWCKHRLIPVDFCNKTHETPSIGVRGIKPGTAGPQKLRHIVCALSAFWFHNAASCNSKLCSNRNWIRGAPWWNRETIQSSVSPVSRKRHSLDVSNPMGLHSLLQVWRYLSFGTTHHIIQHLKPYVPTHSSSRRFKMVLTMVHNIQQHSGSRFYSSSGSLKNRKNNVSELGSIPVLT